MASHTLLLLLIFKDDIATHHPRQPLGAPQIKGRCQEAGWVCGPGTGFNISLEVG